MRRTRATVGARRGRGKGRRRAARPGAPPRPRRTGHGTGGGAWSNRLGCPTRNTRSAARPAERRPRRPGLPRTPVSPTSSKASADPALDRLAVNTIRFLAVDAVEKARSGPPGLPMGMADVGYMLWTRFMRHGPADPSWPGRDRFVLSAGHGAMLLSPLLIFPAYPLP